MIHKRLRQVVLIDEIDKADIDFPNDLLDVLGTFSFMIDDLPAGEEKDCGNSTASGASCLAIATGRRSSSSRATARNGYRNRSCGVVSMCG